MAKSRTCQLRSLVLALALCVAGGCTSRPQPTATASRADSHDLVRLLTSAEFKATFREPMRNTSARPEPVVDIFPYVHGIPAADLQGSTVDSPVAEYVYRSGDDHYDHVMLPTSTRNVYLVVVVDRPAAKVLGHYLLDLDAEYGLANPPN